MDSTPTRNVVPQARRLRTHRRAAMGTALAVAVAAFVGLWAISRSVGDRSERQASTPRSSAAPPEPAAPPEGLRISAQMQVEGWIVLPTPSGPLVAGGGRLFDADLEKHEAREIAAGDWDYDYVQLAEAEDGTVLIASGRTLWHLDPRSGRFLDRFDFGELGYLDAVLSSPIGTWVTASGDERNVLAQIDLGTGTVLRRFPIGQGLHQLGESAGYLFVGSQAYDGTAIVRIDPSTGAVTPLGLEVGSMAVIGSRVWVASGDEATCTDAIDLTSCGAVAVERATSLASDGQLLWVLSSTGSKDPSLYEPDPGQPATVTMLNGNTGDVLAGPMALHDHSPATITARGGNAWVGFHDSGRILRIDPCDPETCVS